MATIAENLLALQQTKQNFKTSFESKGVDLTDVPFTEYPNKLEDLKENLDTELTEQESALEELESAVNELSDKDDTALKILDGTLEEFDNNVWGLTSLRDYQFQDFTNLKKINLTGITEIPQYAFQKCKNAENIVLDKNTSQINTFALGNSDADPPDIENNTFDFETNVDCVLYDYAFYNSLLTSIKGTFSFGGSSSTPSIYQCRNLKNVDINIIGSKLCGNFMSGCVNVQSIKLNFDNYTGTSMGSSPFAQLGTRRPNPENNVFNLDFRKTGIKTSGTYICSGHSVLGRTKYIRFFFPRTLTKVNSYAFSLSDNCTTYFTGATPSALDSYFFQNSTNYKIFVPYNSINAYKIATNWVTHANYIFGWAEENTFEQGAVLPTTSDEGLTLTWYSDENMTTQVTSVTDASKIYYCVASEVA